MAHAHAKLQSDEPLGPLRLLHHHPGYLRAQADAFIGRTEADPVMKAAKHAGETTPGYRKWFHNSKTGSFVLEYEPGDVDVDEVLARIAKKSGLSDVVFDIHSNLHRKELLNGLYDAVQEVNGIVSRATGHRADLRELIPAVLTVTSLVSFILGDRAGRRVPNWDSALYRGYRIFMQWHKKDVEERQRIARKLEEEAEKASHALEVVK